jgi:hypothetical protein
MRSAVSSMRLAHNSVTQACSRIAGDGMSGFSSSNQGAASRGYHENRSGVVRHFLTTPPKPHARVAAPDRLSIHKAAIPVVGAELARAALAAGVFAGGGPLRSGGATVAHARAQYVGRT